VQASHSASVIAGRFFRFGIAAPIRSHWRIPKQKTGSIKPPVS